MGILRKLKGRALQKNKFSYITDFQDGYALAVEKERDLNFHRVVIIDDNYNVVSVTRYIVRHLRFANKYFIALDYSKPIDKNDVFLDANLKEVPDLSFRLISFFSKTNDYAKIDYASDLLGLINSNLDILLEPKYSGIYYIGKDLFFVKSSPSFIFNAKTRTSINVCADMVWECKNGMYRFSANGLYGFLNSDFKISIPAKYSKVSDFDSRGYAPFQYNDSIGVVDKQGNEKIR